MLNSDFPLFISTYLFMLNPHSSFSHLPNGNHSDLFIVHLSFVCVCVLSRVRLFATPWTVTHQAPLSMEFSRQEYRSGLPLPTPEDLIFLTQGSNLCLLHRLRWQVLFTTVPLGKPIPKIYEPVFCVHVVLFHVKGISCVSHSVSHFTHLCTFKIYL